MVLIVFQRRDGEKFNMTENKMFVCKCQCKRKPIVDILMVTYNHESYIAQAIESVLSQKTKYIYRLLIGEDCSTDSTQQIVLDYYKKYPDKIELYLWKKNMGVSRNTIELWRRCQGKYIAYLEGDDYWTDPKKLEKQISFLEEHREYIGAVHNVRCVNDRGELLHRDFGLYPIWEEHIYGVEQAEKIELAAQTASLIHRNIYKFEEIKDLFLRYKGNGDVKINVLLGLTGDIYYFRDIMADHRRVFRGDSWTARSSGRNLLWFQYIMRCELKKYITKHKKIELATENTLLYWEESMINFFCQCSKENLIVCGKFLKQIIKEKIFSLGGR